MTTTQPHPGSAFAGGIYAGIMRGASVVLPAYHLIVATGPLADQKLTGVQTQKSRALTASLTAWPTPKPSSPVAWNAPLRRPVLPLTLTAMPTGTCPAAVSWPCAMPTCPRAGG